MRHAHVAVDPGTEVRLLVGLGQIAAKDLAGIHVALGADATGIFDASRVRNANGAVSAGRDRATILIDSITGPLL